MDNLLSSFIDTLNLVLLPYKQYNVSYQSSIQNRLDELEGDQHTFFYKENVMQLFENGYIPFDFIEAIEIIRNRINCLGASLWNPNDFIENNEWKDIRNMVINLLKKDFGLDCK